MSHEELPDAQTAAGRLAVKLQALFDALPEDEKAIMARIVRLAVGHTDVQGYAAATTGAGSSQPSTELPATESPNPIDDFRANLGLYLRQDG